MHEKRPFQNIRTKPTRMVIKSYTLPTISNRLNFMIKKRKKIFRFSQKHVAKNRKFLSANLKAKAKLKIFRKKSHLHFFLNFFILYFLIFFFFIFFYFQTKKVFMVEEVQPLPHFRFIPPNFLNIQPENKVGGGGGGLLCSISYFSISNRRVILVLSGLPLGSLFNSRVS